MKVSITELRDMIAETVRKTVSEARKPKEIPQRSEESTLAQRDRHVRSLPGYAHGEVLDMSKPLGRKNLAKRQGAANMGNWTSEGPTDARARRLSEVLEAHGIPRESIGRIVADLYPNRSMALESIRKLVRMIVREEIRVTR